MLFDLLYLDGESTMPCLRGAPRAARGLELAGDRWQTPSYHRGDGGALLAATAERGLEGVVAKRLDSPYLPDGDHRVAEGQERPRPGDRDRGLGSARVGARRRSARCSPATTRTEQLRYAGKVGTGFTEDDLGGSPSCSSRCDARTARSPEGSRRRTRCSPSRAGRRGRVPRSGRRRGRCDTRPSRACATTRTHTTSSARSPPGPGVGRQPAGA